MKLTLTDEQKQQLERQHRKEKNGKVRDRIKAVLLYSEGWKQEHIAQALRIHETTVWEHLNEYATLKKLTLKSGGSSSKISEEQSLELEKYLEENTCANTNEIIAYVKEQYDLTYTQQGMQGWLARHEFSYKKPSGVPAKFDAKRQEEFIETYKKLKEELEENELILFMDSVHPTQATKISYGWIKKKGGKAIATVAGRNRINLTGAIELNELSIVTDDYETINGSSTVNFLKKVIEAYPSAQTIHIIADGGRAHTSHEVDLFLGKSNAVNKVYLNEVYGVELPSNTQKLSLKMKSRLKEILQKEPDLFTNHDILENNDLTAIELLKTLKEHPPHPKIVLHILPPYSPNLNPIERGWKLMNEYVRNNRVFASITEFKETIRNFFNIKWKTILDKVSARINDNFQTLQPVF